MYLRGRGVDRDFLQSAEWFRKASEQGNALAQNNLGFQYNKGLGVPQDQLSALRWFQKAAAQGLPDAQLNLGLMYANGQGVTRDLGKALKLVRLSKDGGNLAARAAITQLVSSTESAEKKGSGSPLP
jgi:hypothetical protein